MCFFFFFFSSTFLTQVTRGVFYETVGRILAALPERKQVLAVSATYTSRLNMLLGNVMKHPQVVRVDDNGLVSNELVLVSSHNIRKGKMDASGYSNGQEVFPALHGVKQLVSFLPSMRVERSTRPTAEETPSQQPHSQPKPDSNKVADPVLDAMIARLLELLVALSPFRQCTIFCNDRRHTEVVCERLLSNQYPAAFISAHVDQELRLSALDRFRSGEVSECFIGVPSSM